MEDPNKICRECGTFRFPDIDVCVHCNSVWPDKVLKKKPEDKSWTARAYDNVTSGFPAGAILTTSYSGPAYSTTIPKSAFCAICGKPGIHTHQNVS